MELTHALALSVVLHLGMSVGSYWLIRRRIARTEVDLSDALTRQKAAHQRQMTHQSAKCDDHARFARALAARVATVKRELEEHGPHVREHDCRYEASSVENDGMEHHYRCVQDPSCKARLIFKMVGAASRG